MIEATERYAFLEHGTGKTHYDLAGPEQGELAVLVNGATLPLGVWQPLLAPLHQRGIRTLRFDLSGRGRSTTLGRPEGLETDMFQIEALADEANSNAGFHLVGLASGALSVARFACAFPERVKSATLIAPDGMSTRFTAAERLTMTPLAGEILSAALGKRALLGRAPRYSPRQYVREFVRTLLTEALRGKSYRRSVLAYVRALPLHRGQKLYAELAATPTPVSVLWGELDQITPVAAAGRLRQLFGADAVTILDGVGHLPHVEAPTRVADLLAVHFRAADQRHPARS